MSKKWSSFKEQQLITENFRKWLSVEYTPPKRLNESWDAMIRQAFDMEPKREQKPNMTSGSYKAIIEAVEEFLINANNDKWDKAFPYSAEEVMTAYLYELWQVQYGYMKDYEQSLTHNKMELLKMNVETQKKKAAYKKLSMVGKGAKKVKDFAGDVASGIGDTAKKVKDFAGDVKDKFFEEHGDKYSENRELVEEIIDKALANIDKRKK